MTDIFPRARLFFRALVWGAPKDPPTPSRSGPSLLSPKSATAVKLREDASSVPPPSTAPGPEPAGEPYLPPVIQVWGRPYALVDYCVTHFGDHDLVLSGSYRAHREPAVAASAPKVTA